MAEILIPSKKDIKGAITYDDINIAGRDFTPGATIKVYFMPTTAMENGAQVPYKPYTDAQAAANQACASVNASYVGIDRLYAVSCGTQHRQWLHPCGQRVPMIGG